jgi:hypothetical protein
VERFQLLVETKGVGLDWKGTRDRILQEIIELQDPTGQRRTRDHHFINSIRVLMYAPKSALRLKLADLKFRADNTPEQAKARLAEHRKLEHADNPYHPYEKMPAEITAADIKAASVGKIKFLNQRYGVDQVRDRLNQI